MRLKCTAILLASSLLPSLAIAGPFERCSGFLREVEILIDPASGSATGVRVAGIWPTTARVDLLVSQNIADEHELRLDISGQASGPAVIGSFQGTASFPELAPGEYELAIFMTFFLGSPVGDTFPCGSFPFLITAPPIPDLGVLSRLVFVAALLLGASWTLARR
jgi:hypothetical protein